MKREARGSMEQNSPGVFNKLAPGKVKSLRACRVSLLKRSLFIVISLKVLLKMSEEFFFCVKLFKVIATLIICKER